MNIKDWEEIKELMELRERLVGIHKASCIVIHVDGVNKKEYSISLNGEWGNCDKERVVEIEQVHGSMLRCYRSVKIDILCWIEEIEDKLRKLGVEIGLEAIQARIVKMGKANE